MKFHFLFIFFFPTSVAIAQEGKPDTRYIMIINVEDSLKVNSTALAMGMIVDSAYDYCGPTKDNRIEPPNTWLIKYRSGKRFDSKHDEVLKKLRMVFGDSYVGIPMMNDGRYHVVLTNQIEVHFKPGFTAAQKTLTLIKLGFKNFSADYNNGDAYLINCNQGTGTEVLAINERLIKRTEVLSSRNIYAARICTTN